MPKKKSKKKKSKTTLLKTAGKLFMKVAKNAREYDKELDKEYEGSVFSVGAKQKRKK